MKLFQGWTSSASWRVRWGFALKRVSFEPVWIDIAGGEQSAELAALNPMRAVPTLELDDGRVLTESVAILEWLDETIPSPPLLPREPFARARARELVQLVNAGIHPLQNSKVLRAIGGGELGRAWPAQWIERGLAAFEAHVTGSRTRFSLGDQVSMVDLFIVPQVRNAARHGADTSRCPRVMEIYAACMETPEARATDPEHLRSLAGRS